MGSFWSFCSLRLSYPGGVACIHHKITHATPLGRQVRGAVSKYPRVTPSGSGRVRPDATRVSPPDAERGFSATDPRLRRPGGAHVRPSHLHLSNSTPGKPDRPGKARLPAAVQSCPPRKHEEVKRRKALVRNAAPVAALRLGQSLRRKGLPVHDADRRALRRFTAVISVGPRPTRSGRACLPARIADRSSSRAPCARVVSARKAESRGAPRCPAG